MNNGLGDQVRLSPAMFFITLLTTLFGLVYVVPPWDSVKLCGPSTYWAVLVAFIFMLPFWLVLTALNRRFPGQNIFQVTLMVFGGVVGRIINLLYLGFFLCHYGLLMRGAIELIAVYFLDQTPFWALLILIFTGVAYIAYDGLFSISRIAGFVVIPAVLLRVVMQLFALQDMSATQLLPLVTASLTDYLKAGFSMVSPFNPLIGLLVIYPLLNKPRQLGKITLGLLSCNALLLLLTVITTVGVFGAPVIATLDWPLFEVVRRVNLTFIGLDQAGLLFVIVWLTLFLVGAAFIFYLIGTGVQQQFRRVEYRWAIFGVLVFVIMEGLLIPDYFYTNEIFYKLRPPAIIAISGYPILVYCGALLRGIRGRKLT